MKRHELRLSCVCIFVCTECMFASMSTRVCGFHGKAQQPSSPAREGEGERKEPKKEGERKSEGGLLSQRNKDSCN